MESSFAFHITVTDIYLHNFVRSSEVRSNCFVITSAFCPLCGGTVMAVNCAMAILFARIADNAIVAYLGLKALFDSNLYHGVATLAAFSIGSIVF